MTRVALLRGVNVGGNKKIKMAELVALFGRLGLERPRSLLQSGNVVFEGGGAEADLVARVEAGIEQTFGFASHVVLRELGEVRAAIAGDPFRDAQRDAPSRLHLMFLREAPAGTVAWDGPEQLAILGREAHIYYPNGAGTSKLTGALLERRLGTLGTARNWNTVTKLLELMGG